MHHGDAALGQKVINEGTNFLFGLGKRGGGYFAAVLEQLLLAVILSC